MLNEEIIWLHTIWLILQQYVAFIPSDRVIFYLLNMQIRLNLLYVLRNECL
jgi:hypothetical protein